MLLGENDRDLTALEKKAGQKAARVLRNKLKTILATSTVKQTGKAIKLTSVYTNMKNDTLDHLSIKTPHYVFKQHYGFEGIKKNGVAMNMKPYDHFGKLFGSTKALDTLADEISDIRAEAITSKIRF